MIENTAKFRFPASAPRPSWIEIASFVKELGCNVLDMEAVYKMGDDRSVCIKFKTADAMEEALQRIVNTVKFKYACGKLVDVDVVPAGINVRYVRVFDVPPEVTDEDLALVFGNYGKVERMVREKFPSELGLANLFNGVRGLYVDIERDIPSTVDVLHWKAKVYYEGLKNKCFLCQSEGHRKNTCPQRGKGIQQGKKNLENKSLSTYAGVVVQTVAPSMEQETIEIVEDDDIIEEERQPEAVVTENTQSGSTEHQEKAEPIVYGSQYEKDLAENWAKHEAEQRRKREEYRKHEKSMQRRYEEDLRAREKEQMDHWQKCEEERRSRQEKYKREMSQQSQANQVKEQIQSPPKKSSRKQ